jgi:hypothetical protein
MESLFFNRTTAESWHNAGNKLPSVSDNNWWFGPIYSHELFHEGSLCLSGLSDDAITRLNLPTGIPFIFEFDADFKPIASMKFLSDEDTVQKAMEKVASIGRAPN